MIAIHDDPPVLRVDESGTIRVGECRVMLDLVVEHYREGRTPAEIVDSFPTLKLADVYSAIAYYLRHPAEIQEYLDEGEKLAEEWRAKSEADPKIQALKRRIEAARKERTAAASR